MRNKVLPSFPMAALICASAAQAQDPSGWSFQVMPHAWLSGLEGELGTSPGQPSVDLDLSFLVVVEDLYSSGMELARAQRPLGDLSRRDLCANPVR